MKLFLIALLALSSTLAIAQTAATVPAPVSIPVPTAAISTLPSILAGGGTSWTRGQAYPYSAVIHFALRVGTSNWYSWSEISTPVTTVPNGAPPLPSTLTTGGAWVAAQSSSGNISLAIIMTAGFSTVQATSSTAPAFSGSFGVPIRIKKSNVYVMPYFKASNASAGGANGAVATFVLQPGISILYGWAKKN